MGLFLEEESERKRDEEERGERRGERERRGREGGERGVCEGRELKRDGEACKRETRVRVCACVRVWECVCV